MRYCHVVLAVLTAAVFAHSAAAREAPVFKVVVHAENPVDSVSSEVLARLFLRQQSRWEDGTSSAPVDQLAGSEVREAFSRAVLSRSMSSVQSYWQRQIYSGRSAPPPEVGSDVEVLTFVELEPGGVGYVSASATLPASVRILDVSDLEGYDASALSAGTRVAPVHSADETVSSHGDLRLFLTGSCGPADQGRHAVLENRHPYDPLTATIETSVWGDGWMRSSSVSRHTVQPLADKLLGCTWRGGDDERRYAIVEASSAGSHRIERRPGRPARSVISIVDSGTCGQGRAGQWRSLLNRHPQWEIRAAVEFRELVKGQVRRSYRKNFQLAPGASKRLGCSADGPMTRRFALLEVVYR